MTKLNVYSAKGVKKAAVSLPKRFQEKLNLPLLAQAIRVYEARRHPGLSKVKSRGEVKASTRKIWRQKGTGRARHGAISAPIFVGGGIAHGPKGVKRELKLPKNMRRKALNMALTLKAKAGEVVVVDGVSSLKKTKEAALLLNKIVTSVKERKANGRFTFVLSDKNLGARLALRNLASTSVVSFKNLNAHKAYFGGVLLIDKEALGTKKLVAKKGKKGK